MAAKIGDSGIFRQLFKGQKVRLTPPDFEVDATVYARWCQDRDFWMAMHEDPYRPLTIPQAKKRLEAVEKEEASQFQFAIHALDDGRLVGWMRAESLQWSGGSAQYRLAIGDPKERGKGFGRETLELMLRFGFDEMNFHRIAIPLVSYQIHAQTELKQMGFQIEVCRREAIFQDGKYWDALLMGLMAPDWWASHSQGEEV